MFAQFLRTLRDDTGAVTVDWVVLTGASITLAIVALGTLNQGTTGLAEQVETVLTDVEVADLSPAVTADDQDPVEDLVP